MNEFQPILTMYIFSALAMLFYWFLLSCSDVSITKYGRNSICWLSNMASF